MMDMLKVPLSVRVFSVAAACSCNSAAADDVLLCRVKFNIAHGMRASVTLVLNQSRLARSIALDPTTRAKPAQMILALS